MLWGLLGVALPAKGAALAGSGFFFPESAERKAKVVWSW